MKKAPTKKEETFSLFQKPDPFNIHLAGEITSEICEEH